MTLEEFIERYLLTEREVIDVYDSMYEMGNKYVLEDDCEDIDVTKEIIENEKSVDKNDIEAEAQDFVKKFYRSGGLINRLQNYIDFDLEAFDSENKQYKCERCKILYFFYTLVFSKNKCFDVAKQAFYGEYR